MAWKGSCREVGRGWEGAEERGSSRRGGGVCPKLRGSRIEHASTHTLHSLGTRPLFMLDIIPLSKHTHFSRVLLTCVAGHTRRGETR